ncbi:hypothetical protein LTR33_002653 [Friedmanniomyces endolithicus]|nr:hypothetical protein LTR33_002653 [Friedmanniomyces endolithicus]
MSKPVALITGGGSGIGLAIAEHLINIHGYRVVILDVNKERGAAEAKRLNNADNCLFKEVDVTDFDQQAQAFQQTCEWGGGRLDMFVANAGIGDGDSVYKDLKGVDEKTGLPKPVDLRTLDVNLNAVIQGVHLARHFFLKNATPGGKIVITSSCLGVYANHSLPLYSASKDALVGFVRSTAPVFTGMDITINALLPVLIETNLMPEAVRPLWDRAQLTPLSTVSKAIDSIMDAKVTGQTIELSLDQTVFSKQQAFSTPNAKWMCEQHKLWEMACEPLLPKPPGQNVGELQ